MTILLLARAGDVRRLIRDMLTRSEHLVFEATDERGVRAATTHGPIDLVIAEVSPVVDGRAVVGALREDAPDLRAVYVTAWHDHPKLPPLGEEVVVKAPFTREELLRAIRSALSQ